MSAVHVRECCATRYYGEFGHAGDCESRRARVCDIETSKRGVCTHVQHAEQPHFIETFPKRLSFGRGTILSARFTADGQSVVYGAASPRAE